MSKPPANQVVLVTGASAGIGAATAMRLSRAGCRVFGTSRRAGQVAPEPSVTMLQLDVREAQSVGACIAAVVKDAGRIDALVNNAGYGIAAAIEDTTADDMLRQLDTN